MKKKKFLLFAAMLSVATLITAQNKADLKKEFNTIDSDGNEVITLREMVIYYKSTPDEKGLVINGKQQFYGLDHNENRIISIHEYINGFDLTLANANSEKWHSPSSSLQNEQSTDSIAVEKPLDN